MAAAESAERWTHLGGPLRGALLSILLACVIGCSRGTGDEDSTAMADAASDGGAAPALPSSLDHLVLGVHDLQAGIDEFERLTGVRPEYGGAHPGRGTRNALVSLGGERYLEILAPNANDSAGARVASEFASYTRLTPIDWAVQSEDLDALAESLAAEDVTTGSIRPGARARANGVRLEWRTLSVLDPAHRLIPFFIQWGASIPHPATESPSGCTLVALRFEDPEPDELTRIFGRLGIAVAMVLGPASRMHLGLACPKGNVEIPVQLE